MTALAERLRLTGRLSAVQEALLIWGLTFAAIVLSFVLLRGYAKLVATVAFLYLPLWPMRERGEDFRDYGVTFDRWRDDLKLFAVLFAIVAPLFFLAFYAFGWLMPYVPPAVARHLSPFTGAPHFVPRLPPRFAEWVVDQLFVVALPEEFFYRGFLQSRLRDAWPKGRMVLGARLGPAFLLTAALFAVGHLAIFEVWRLSVFFPALLFGFMRERTHTVMGAALFHAACNLYSMVLQASFFGG